MSIWHILSVAVSAASALGVDVWCGKAYRSENSSFDPGGWLNPPPPSEVPLLNLQAYPHMNIYLADEKEASIIIDSEISRDVGVPYCQVLGPETDSRTLSPAINWQLQIKSPNGEGDIDVQAYIHFNSTGNEIPIPIDKLAPRYAPYEIEVTIKLSECYQSFVVKTHVYHLPTRTDGGSVTRLDYLYGGLQVRERSTWKPVFPFGFYVDWGGYLRHIENQDEYASLGYSIISPVPAGGDTPFEPDLFTSYVERLDKGSSSLIYNMRWTYKDDALVTLQVEELKKHKSVLLWYTADEPGGQGDPLDAPLQAYDLIKKVDPYHPVSLVLNCANFHYAEYTRGADIILTDPYPIAVNTSWSNRWKTECNTTYGCCGCDNCAGNFRDVSNRLDNFKRYQRWLSNAPLGKPSLDPGTSPAGPKIFWGVPQVFGGSEYWARSPTTGEEMVMIWLFINHGAKGIVGWLFPTTPELTSVMSAMAKLVTSKEITTLLLGDNPRRLDIEVEEGVDIDAAAWIVGESMLLSIVYLGLEDTDASVTVKLPRSVNAESARQLWPGAEYPRFDSRENALDETVFRFQGERLTWEEDRSRTSWSINGSEAKRLGLPAKFVSLLIIDLTV